MIIFSILKIMESNIYTNCLLERRVQVPAKALNKNLEKNIVEILINDIGDKCVAEGFVKKDSIQIQQRSEGKVDNTDFRGNTNYIVRFTADICNPVRGNIIKCKVDRINKLGVMSLIGPLSIIVIKQYHINKGLFKDLEVGKEISVEVIGARFSVNDDTIQVIGKLSNDTKVKKSNKIEKIKKQASIFTKNPGIDDNLENKQSNIDKSKDKTEIDDTKDKDKNKDGNDEDDEEQEEIDYLEDQDELEEQDDADDEQEEDDDEMSEDIMKSEEEADDEYFEEEEDDEEMEDLLEE